MSMQIYNIFKKGTDIAVKSDGNPVTYTTTYLQDGQIWETSASADIAVESLQQREGIEFQKVGRPDDRHG